MRGESEPAIELQVYGAFFIFIEETVWYQLKELIIF
jgi:hypothetical protein